MVTETKIPKGYKNTDIGVIPDDWDVKRLGDLGTFKKGRGIKKDEVLSDGLPCVRYGEIYTHHNDYVKKFNSFISLGTAKESQKIKQGDLLFSGSGETAEEIGKCVAYLNQDEAYAGGDIIILSPAKDDSKFLGFLLNTEVAVRQKSQIAQGDAVVHIYSSNLSNVILPLPSTKKEQSAIATIIGDCDDLIDKLKELISKKKNIKQGAMQELLTGKKRLPGFRGKWVTKQLGEIFLISAGGDLVKESFSCVEDDRYCYPIYSNSLTNKGLYGYTVRYRHDENCITVTARGTVGVANARDHKFDAIGRLLILRPNCDLNCLFVAEYLNQRVKFSVESTGVPQLTAPQISHYEIMFPENDEQSTIAQVLSDMDAEIEELEQKLDKYKMIKQGMMQELLTGRTRLI